MSADDRTTSVEYREIPGFPGYRIGSDGSVWSVWNTNGDRVDWHPLKGWMTSDGYRQVSLSVGGSRVQKGVHVLVLEAFVGPCPSGMEACHGNGNPADNRPENLRWDTHRANMHDAIRHGTFCFNRRLGSQHGRAKLTEADIPVIRRLLVDGVPASEIASSLGIDRYQVYSIKTGKTWGHVPYEGDVTRERVASVKAQRQGTHNGRATLTESQVAEIKQAIRDGAGNRYLVRFYGVTLNVIGKIRHGLTWKHVT
jgi:hypothetical protein